MKYLILMLFALTAHAEEFNLIGGDILVHPTPCFYKGNEYWCASVAKYGHIYFVVIDEKGALSIHEKGKPTKMVWSRNSI